jgi:hypothetical protein
LGLRECRLKTGTPPRLDGRTIDGTQFEEQPGDDDPTPFSFRKYEFLEDVCCGRSNAILRVYDAGDAAADPRECASFADVFGAD